MATPSSELAPRSSSVGKRKPLPEDIIVGIAAACGPSELAALCRTSKSFLEIATSALYRHITIDIDRNGVHRIPGHPSDRHRPLLWSSATGAHYANTYLATGLRVTRVVDLHSHPDSCIGIRIGRKPKISLNASLLSVHTVRITLKKCTGIFGSATWQFCPRQGVCRLIQLARPKYIVIRYDCKEFAAFAPAFARAPPESRHDLMSIGISNISPDSADEYICICPGVEFLEAFTRLSRGGSGITIALPAGLQRVDMFDPNATCDELVSELYTLFQRANLGSSRLLCGASLVSSVQQCIATFSPGQGEGISQTIDPKLEAFRKEVKVQDFGQVRKEPWVEAFKGEDPENW